MAGGDNTAAVGILGAGRMGLPIIGHVVRAGFRAFVYDPDTAKKSLVEEKGGEFLDASDSVAERCRTVMVCVGYEEQLRALMLGGGGLLQQLSGGSVVAILSTVSPEAMREVYDQARPWDVGVVDAPVCRGGWAADAGELLSLIGGDKEVFDRFEPIAHAYSSDIVWTGGIGTGQVAKAVNNLILWACLVADHEGLALANSYGLDTAKLREALEMSSAANHALDDWGKQSMAWAEDDMKIVEEMTAHVGIRLPQTEVTRQICRVLKPWRYRLDQYGRLMA